MKFSKTKLLSRCLLSSALLASGAVASAADQSKNSGLLQDLVTGRKASATSRVTPAARTTTVQAELQKLFKSGQVQTSQHQTSAANPTVRLIQHESNQQSPGLLSKLFGGSTAAERRAKRLEERAKRGNPQASNKAPSVPKPPPIDFANQQQAKRKASINARPVGFGNEVAEPPSVPPAGAANSNSIPLRPAVVDEFVSPFIDDESLERKSVMLDLDSLIDRPSDRSEAMPITTEGSVVQRLIELPIPLKPPETDPLRPANTPSLPAAETAQQELVTTKPVSEQTVTQQSVMEEAEELIVIQSKVSPTKVSDAVDSPETESENSNVISKSEPLITGSDVDQQAVTMEPAPKPTAIEPPATESPAAEPKTAELTPAEKEERTRLSIRENNARRQQQRYLIMSRAGRTGFKGFCPVALRESRTLRDSSTTHAARFGLKTYYFGSEDARMRFEADPARYAPAAGGSDVVLLANTGEETEGSLDFCLWYRDRLYMFRSRESQAIFSSDPARFANQY